MQCNYNHPTVAICFRVLTRVALRITIFCILALAQVTLGNTAKEVELVCQSRLPRLCANNYYKGLFTPPTQSRQNSYLVCNCVHTANADKTRQFCLDCVSGVNTVGDATKLSSCHVDSVNRMQTRQEFCLVSSCVHTTDADQTRQFVSSASAV